jgi:hypothetical protein
MKQLELEVEIDDNKISVTEEFFKFIPFVRKVMTISPQTEKSADDTPEKILNTLKYVAIKIIIKDEKEKFNYVVVYV